MLSIDETPLLRLEGETFEEWWKRRWYADNLGAAAYGDKTVIARIRRGHYRRIPPHWRGKVTTKQTIRKRDSKHPNKASRGFYGRYAKGETKLALDERRGPTLADWGIEDGYAIEEDTA